MILVVLKGFKLVSQFAKDDITDFLCVQVLFQVLFQISILVVSALHRLSYLCLYNIKNIFTLKYL